VAIAGDLAGGVESLIEHRASIGADSTCLPDCCGYPPESKMSTTFGAISAISTRR
jgi:hypothetical protein